MINHEFQTVKGKFVIYMVINTSVKGKFVIYMVINTSGLKDSTSSAGEVLYPTTTKVDMSLFRHIYIL